MARAKTRRRRDRGGIDELPSGALRVRVYAGIDPISRRRNYLVETIPPGPDAARQAEKATAAAVLTDGDDIAIGIFRLTFGHLGSDDPHQQR